MPPATPPRAADFSRAPVARFCFWPDGRAFQAVRRAEGLSARSVDMIMTQCEKAFGPPGCRTCPCEGYTNVSPFHVFSFLRRPCDFALLSSLCFIDTK
eukprot:5732995-Pleurochrysis_carterae.AAC.1